ncbi:MAG: class 3 adenylate cyclase/GAF domain-containing protein, partial [bacterium]
FELNLACSKKAKLSSAYQPALSYLKIAKQLLPQSSWLNEYSKSYEIFYELSECAYLCNEWDFAEELIIEMFLFVIDPLEKAKILQMQIFQYTTTYGKVDSSIELGLKALRGLGIKIKINPSTLAVGKELLFTKWGLRGKSKEVLLESKITDDPKIRLIMKIMINLTAPIYMSGNENLLGFVSLKMMNLSLKFGYTPETANAFVFYGGLIGTIFGDHKNGYEYGKIGIQLNERFDDVQLRCRTLYTYICFSHHFNEHYETLAPLFLQGIEAGLQSGDSMYIGFSCANLTQWNTSSNLAEITQQANEYFPVILDTKVPNTIHTAQIFQGFRLNLQDQNSKQFSLCYQDFDETTCLKEMEHNGFKNGVALYHIYKLQLYYFYENYDSALYHIEETKKEFNAIKGTLCAIEFSLYHFLILSGIYQSLSFQEKRKALCEMKSEYKQMKTLAKHCPQNFLHLQYIMQAEIFRLKKKKLQAIESYDNAIQQAEKNHYPRYQTLACELAGKFYIEQKQEHLAKFYLKEAYYGYIYWGASRKVQWLKDTYSLLNFQENSKTSNYEYEDFRTHGGTTSSSSGHHLFDMDSVIKASQSISGEFILENLVKKLVEIACENAGAEKGFLLLYHEKTKKLSIQAGKMGDKELPAMQSIDFVNSNLLATKIIQYVAHSYDYVVLNNASHQNQFSHDPYLKNNPVKSVLCFPILNQNELQGVFYLENNITSHVFTPDRLEVLKILATQSAISIKNSQLYTHITQLNQTFEKFVPAQFLSRIAKEGIEKIELGKAQSDFITILFADIRSFTNLSENLTPQELLNFLNSYFQEMNKPIHLNHGFIDKFIGDAVMALFDNPEGTDDKEAYNAVQAAIGMQVALQEYNVGRQRAGYQKIEVGIGIHSGDSIIGTVGSKDRMDSTILGDNVNLASRLEGLSKYYQADIVISEITLELLEPKEQFQYRLLDQVRVVGKKQPVQIFEIYNHLPKNIQEQKKIVGSWIQKGLQFRKEQKWELAENAFQTALDIVPEEKLPIVHLKQLEKLKTLNLPENWDGTVDLDTK